MTPLLPPPATAFASLPLQSSFTWAEVALLGVDLTSALAGVVISYIAYQGYRRTGSRAMAFVAVGFVLIMVVPWLGFLATLVAGSSPPFELAVGAVSEVSQLLGTLAILYGIRLETRT
ncbi:DUF7521 family protein [Halosimplex pelagicum]|uniref:Uncharacterized protein n=1 Tax=Halosimplex pelagicum TaxID=869886 RepID=A0A7D5P7D8_9EURY|nr:hypothetical protein [Halosimplex pelagicum]QLH80364.1 hypothetical protein HZS54_01395 [Halosimplex pelagicum]